MSINPEVSFQSFKASSLNMERVGVEVVESHRIPDSADILAVYEVCLDESGELESYRRTQRYSRGQTIGRSR